MIPQPLTTLLTQLVELLASLSLLMLGIGIGAGLTGLALFLYDRWITSTPRARMVRNYYAICGRDCTIHRATRIAP